jgi:hypothetical protein
MSTFTLDRDLSKGTKLVCKRYGDPYTVVKEYRQNDILRSGIVRVAQDTNPDWPFSVPADELWTLFRLNNDDDF